MAQRVQRILYATDFDWSFADQDTDRYVFEVLAPELRTSLREGKKTTQWTDNVAKHLVKLHEQGATKQQITESLQDLPVHPAMVRGLKDLKNSEKTETTFLCLSNSNSVYIDTILKHRDMDGFFDEIITNPAEFKDSGLLELRRRVAADDKQQHGCKIGCSPNMCKGDELDAFVARHGGWDAFDRVIYVGDGGNDFCPLLRMRSQDVAMVRMYRELSRRIIKDADNCGLKCECVPWGGAWEIEKWLKENC